VLAAVAELCGVLLHAADDVHILATSREQLWVGGEARYRLSSLEVAESDEPGDAGRSEAATLFTERARDADPQFSVSPDDAPLVSHVVARLDGMPLAIELAAARVEAMGMAGLADRIDDALRLLAGKDPLAAARHRSLAAVADWSYQLLSGPEQRTFRRLAVFPGPFTLDAAEAVAGPESGPLVLRLVDCSLLVRPRSGPDQRARYTMLQTLRAYGLDRLRGSGEEQEAMAALAGFAQSVAEQASAELETSDRELGAIRWLNAEEATLSRALNWELDHRPDGALRLATRLAPWWRLRGRMIEGYGRLAAAVRQAAPSGDAGARAQLWLGYLSEGHADFAARLGHYTAACEAGDSRESADALVGRAIAQLNLGHAAEAAQDAGRALALARDLGYPAGEVQALTALSVAVYDIGSPAEALEWAGQAQELLSADVPGWVARWCHEALTLVLTEVGELDSARRLCAEGVTRSRAAGDITGLIGLLGMGANLEWLAGRMADVRAYLREAVDIASRIGDPTPLRQSIDQCALLCAATGRQAEAATLWAALAANLEHTGRPSPPADDRELRRQTEQALDPAQLREAEDRGARMTLSTAIEFVIMLTAQQESEAPFAASELSARERELVTLVAEGRTNAQIAAQLHISVRTVGSHLDRIRDKTGYRRRADLTRLALREGLV
jgi:non-specific serine/threonine protein kinase